MSSKTTGLKDMIDKGDYSKDSGLLLSLENILRDISVGESIYLSDSESNPHVNAALLALNITKQAILIEIGRLKFND